ncbi:hypothetical protein GALL_359930 [mine drainage metagenome]|uniref:Uncharacterized protein n=1 Tax=mine drainage metagenome TaxID=410659 RepID=A0A1J5R250_9ZZZZ
MAAIIETVVGPGHYMGSGGTDLLIATGTPVGLSRCGAGNSSDSEQPIRMLFERLGTGSFFSLVLRIDGSTVLAGAHDPILPELASVAASRVSVAASRVSVAASRRDGGMSEETGETVVDALQSVVIQNQTVDPTVVG